MDRWTYFDKVENLCRRTWAMVEISREKEVVTAETERHLVESDAQFPHHFSPRTLEGGELDAQHRKEP